MTQSPSVSSRLSGAILAILAFQTISLKADLVYNWDFTKSGIDSKSGVSAILGNPSGRDQNGYSFSNGDGITVPQVTDAPVTDTYAIELVFSLTTNDDGYQRIVDFSDLTKDQGMYAYDDYFYFYDLSDDIDNFTFSPNQEVTLLLTRDSNGVFTAKLDGNSLWSFADSGLATVFDAPGHIMHFFKDDGGEHPTGIVKSLRIFDTTSLRDEAAITAKTLECRKLKKQIKKQTKLKKAKNLKKAKKNRIKKKIRSLKKKYQKCEEELDELRDV